MNPKSQKHPEVRRGFANLGKNICQHAWALPLVYFFGFENFGFVLRKEHFVVKLGRTKIKGMPGLQYTQPPD
jgi:hypothetical protein